jgi:hypothetical protein
VQHPNHALCHRTDDVTQKAQNPIAASLNHINADATSAPYTASFWSNREATPARDFIQIEKEIAFSIDA